MKQRSVLVIGLGKIGFGYDENENSNRKIQSHCNAFYYHKKFKLIGGIDNNNIKRKKFFRKYNLPSFDTIISASKSINPEIAVISTPPKSRLRVIQQVIKYLKVKIIIIEKPVALKMNDVIKIRNLLGKHKIRAFVNYFRRSCPGINILKKRKKNNLSRIKTHGIAWYSKGLLNSGSHIINTLEYILGDVKKIKKFYVNNSDFNNDKDACFILFFKNSEILFTPNKKNGVFNNSVEILSKKEKIIFENGMRDIKTYNIIDDDLYNSYKIISPDYKKIKTNYSLMQFYFTDNLSRKIDSKFANICDLSDAIKTHKIIQQIINN